MAGFARESAAETTTTTTTTTTAHVACACPGDVQWDALAGGVVKGSHRLQIDMDFWNEFTFNMTYVYGVLPFLAVGFTTGLDLQDSDFAWEGINIGIPLIFSLLNTEQRSARLAVTPGYFHEPYGDRMNAFYLRLEASYGMWLRRGLLMIGPAVLVQLMMGSYAADSNAGYFQFRMPFMGGPFAEFHPTSWMAITATVMFGALYQRDIVDGRDLGFAYRTLLGVSFFAN